MRVRVAWGSRQSSLRMLPGAQVFTTASAPKQAYLRSLGVEHVFDSRQTAFGKEILEITDDAQEWTWC